MKKKAISRSDARIRAVWKSPASALDRSQRMAVKTLQRYGFSVSVSDDGCRFETAAIASELPEEAAHALEVLNHVGNIRARHSRLSAGMDASARSELWLLIFDCIGLGRHTHARRIVRKKTRMLPGGRKKAKQARRDKGDATKAKLRNAYNLRKNRRQSVSKEDVAADLGMNARYVGDLMKQMKLK